MAKAEPINVSQSRVSEIQNNQLLTMIGQLTMEVSRLTAVNEALSTKCSELMQRTHDLERPTDKGQPNGE